MSVIVGVVSFLIVTGRAEQFEPVNFGIKPGQSVKFSTTKQKKVKTAKDGFQPDAPTAA